LQLPQTGLHKSVCICCWDVHCIISSRQVYSLNVSPRRLNEFEHLDLLMDDEAIASTKSNLIDGYEQRSPPAVFLAKTKSRILAKKTAGDARGHSRPIIRLASTNRYCGVQHSWSNIASSNILPSSL
jgi:hypothetical protein